MPTAAVLGHPIGHSLSPVLHAAAYAALGLADWDYRAIDCDTDQLAPLLTASPSPPWAGFSCTMPLKRVALELAAEADPLATAVGAANTLLPLGDGRWRAEMTDVAGINNALDEVGVPIGTVCVLGAGGTAQAALGALAERGTFECAVLVRDPARTTDLLATAGRLGVQLRIATLAPEAEALDADLIISTLPGPGADLLADRDWREDQAVLDSVYNPWPTALAAAAQRDGAVVISGALMLLHQAAVQVRLMTGAEPPIEAMRSALLGAAPGCGV